MSQTKFCIANINIDKKISLYSLCILEIRIFCSANDMTRGHAIHAIELFDFIVTKLLKIKPAVGMLDYRDAF